MHRPRSVATAEHVYLAATGIMLLTTALAWRDLTEVYSAASVVGTTTLLLGCYLVPTLLTTRRRSRVALWVLVAITALGTLSLFFQIAVGVLAIGLVGILNTLQVILTIAAVVLLFRPAARAWLNDGRLDPSMEDFG